MNKGLDNLRPFLKPIREQSATVGLAMVLSLFVTAFNLAVPLLFKRLYDILEREALPDPAARMKVFGVTIGVVMVIFVVRRICQSLASYLAVSVTQRMAVDVRREVYQHLHGLPLEFFDDQRTGTLVSNVTNDVTALQFLLHDGMVQIFTAPITVLGAVVVIFKLDPVLGGVALAVFPLLYFLIRLSRDHLRRISEENQANISLLTTQFLEAVANIRIVRAFRRQDYELERFGERNVESLDLRLRNARLNAVVEFGTEVIILLGFALVLWVGGARIVRGEITVGTLLALVALMQTMRSSLNALSIAYTRYQQATGAGRRLLDLLNQPPARQHPPVAEAPHTWQGAIELRGVGFSYPDGTVVLDGASITIAPGEKVALIGGSGAGKSTLASLLLGLYEPQQGALYLDGTPLDEVSPDVLLSVISVVPQDVGLFSGTVEENIRYAKLEASREEVIAAASAANAHGFISRLSEGYDTFVGDQGVKLSGGQRQRLAIARAILRNPQVLILDEATSHVDPETESLVQDALTRLMADRTTLIIAHQQSAIRDVDRVIALEGGKLVEVDYRPESN